MDLAFRGIERKFPIIDKLKVGGLKLHMQIVRLRHHHRRALGRGDNFLQADPRERRIAAERERGNDMIVHVRVHRGLAADDILGILSWRFQPAMVDAEITRPLTAEQAALTGDHEGRGDRDENSEKENRKKFIQWSANGCGSTHSLAVSHQDATTSFTRKETDQKSATSILPLNRSITATDHRMVSDDSLTLYVQKTAVFRGVVT